MTGTLAIVILNYNGEKFLQKFLPSVIRYSEGHRIVVADNASSDNSVPMLGEFFPEVEILLLKENYGFAGGYNEALKGIESDYFLLLNSDVEVTAGWLNPMLQLLENFPDVAACQPKIMSYHRPEYFEYAGAAGGYLDLLGYPFCRGRIFNTLEKDRGQYNKEVPIFWASGACMLIRADLFREAGAFDANFFAHMEEIDLCWRIHRLGYKIYVCPDSKVFHVGGGTLATNSPRKIYLNFRNSLWMLYKNSSLKEIIWKIPTRFVLDMVAIVKFLFEGEPLYAKAVLKSQIDFLKFRPKRVGKSMDKIAKAPVYNRFILWEYYGRGKRNFSQLNFSIEDIRKMQFFL